MRTPEHIMPWLEAARASLHSRFKAAHLPHALLIAGEKGVGKRAFAGEVSAFLVCDNPSSENLTACGQCKQCELLAGKSHPDVRVYAPEKSRMIKVDQVRALSGFAVASPQVARRKLIIVDRADQLNINAANALLKTLEEPSADVVLLLLQETGRPILPTLMSRCQRLLIPTPGVEAAMRWLQSKLASSGVEYSEGQQRQALELAGYAPRLALDYLAGDFLTLRADALNAFRRYMKSEIPVSEASKAFKALGLETTLWLMEVWAADLARVSAGGSARDSDAAEMLAFLASVTPAFRAHQLRDAIHESRAASIYNANPELEAQRLLIQWRSLMPARKRRAG